MADMITRCPKCGTAFRISDALLKSAKGVVRCGSCLSVFNAREHLEASRTSTVSTARPPEAKQSKTAQPTPPPQSVPEPTPTSPVSKPFAEADEDDVDMPDWRRRSGQDVSYTSDDTGYEQESDSEEADDEEDDEAWALELLKDDDDLNIQFKKVTPKPSPSEPSATTAESRTYEDAPVSPAAAPTDDVFAEIDEDLDFAQPEPEEDPAPSFADTGAAEVDEEVEPEDKFYSANPYPSARARGSITSVTDFRSPDEDSDVPDERDGMAYEHGLVADGHDEVAEETDAQDDAYYMHRNEMEEHSDGTVERNSAVEPDNIPETPPEPVKRKPIRPKLEPKSTPLKDVIASLEPEPLEVDWQEPGAWRRRLLWPLLALVALLCLLAQVAWLEFDRLSRVEPYRSAYGVACQVVGCELPELLDRSQIHTSNLLVRSHPEVADALQVDVILQNNAPFEQTFPVLELTFTNLRSETVATRRLDPTDYLGGELAGRDKMPVRQPIHIALEVADPGSEAVSYHITIVD